MERFLIAIRDEPLRVEPVVDHLRTPEAGGIDVFVGTTRRWTDGRETSALIYDCYRPMALREMRRLAEEAVERWPVVRAALVHRVGQVPAAEASVVIGVSTPHRADAFAACRFLIDRLKEDVPIWKQERFVDGRTAWVEPTA